MITKWKSMNEARGVAAAMTNGKGEIRFPNNDIARIRASLAIDLEATRRLRAKGQAGAAKFLMECVRQERIFILTGKA